MLLNINSEINNSLQFIRLIFSVTFVGLMVSCAHGALLPARRLALVNVLDEKYSDLRTYSDVEPAAGAVRTDPRQVRSKRSDRA